MKNNSRNKVYTIPGNATNSANSGVRKGIVPGLPIYNIRQESPSVLAKKKISLSPFKISYNASMSTSQLINEQKHAQMRYSKFQSQKLKL
jgi:hypothetical protein